MTSLVPLTQEAIEDGPYVNEVLATAVSARPTHRYRHVWSEGYLAALDDVRKGHLVLKDGYFRLGTVKP